MKAIQEANKEVSCLKEKLRASEQNANILKLLTQVGARKRSFKQNILIFFYT